MRKNWIEIEIGLFADIQNGYAFKSSKYSDSGFRIIRIGNVQNGVIVDRDPKFYPENEIEQVQDFVLKENDILISLTGNVGRAGRIKSSMLPALLNQRVGRFELESTNICDNYLFIFLNSKLFEKQVIKSAKGVAQLNTSSKKIKKIQIPLSPLPEQKAIVAKIEQLFSDLDNGITNLKKAQSQLKIYRLAVLKKAFDGKLTRNKEKWQTKELKELVKFSQGLQVPKPRQSFIKTADSVRFLRIIDFTQGKEEPRYILKPENKYLVKKDEISMVRYGTVGFVCRGKEGVIANNLFKITPIEEVTNSFLFYFFNSPYFTNIINIKKKGSTMSAISFKLLNEIILKYPSIKEQNQIVQEIETRLSVCDNVEANIKEALKKAELLRQSILKKAFEGELLTEAELLKVRNDPEWEPAEKLLKRIKAEKAKTSKQKRKRR